MTTAGWALPRDAVPTGAVGFARLRAAAARVLIAVVPVATVVWVPVATIPGLGHLTLLDVVLLALWPLALLGLRERRASSRAAGRALRIALLALLPGLFAGLGLLVFAGAGSAAVPDASSGAAGEVLLQVKRFGAAAILPLALLVDDSPRLRRACAASLLLVSLAMTAFALHPAFRAALPVQSAVSASFGAGDRQSGLVANPNDYAYLAILTLAMLAALSAGRDVRRSARALMLLAGAVGAYGALMLSGSRSGLVGLLAGVLYLLARGRLAHRHQALVALAVVALLVVGLAGSAVFRDRLARTVTQGTAEPSLAGRLDAQRVLLAVWAANPLGVGYQNFVPVSRHYSTAQPFVDVEGSDSIYVDTLAASGPLGLLALLALLASAWRHLGGLPPEQPVQTDLLRAGWLAMVVIGLSTIAPLSVFVAPYFFLLVGCAALVTPVVGTEGVR
ncbi:MAG TPA: O-antigen ligase family protein [Thermomicrobiaceae bacterium]|nr:O-antigen ligase family protein [Thermomicrobiaceae bacterium]